MADPRGLSGAVFQREPMRDFAKDYTFGQEQRKLREQKALKKEQDEGGFFDGSAKIKNSDHEGFYVRNVIEPLRELSKQYAQAKVSGDSKKVDALKSEIKKYETYAYRLPTMLNRVEDSIKENFKVASRSDAPPELKSQVSQYSAMYDNLSSMENIEWDGEQMILGGRPIEDVFTPVEFSIKEDPLYTATKNLPLKMFVKTDASGGEVFDEAKARKTVRYQLAYSSTTSALVDKIIVDQYGSLNEEGMAAARQDEEIIKLVENIFVDFLKNRNALDDAPADDEGSKKPKGQLAKGVPFESGLAFQAGKNKVTVPVKLYSALLDEGENVDSELAESYVENIVLGENGEVYAKILGLKKDGTQVKASLTGGFTLEGGAALAKQVEDPSEYVRIDNNPQIDASVRAALGVQSGSLYDAIKQQNSQLRGSGRVAQEEEQGDTEVLSLNSLKENYDFGNMSDEAIIDFYEKLGYKVQK